MKITIEQGERIRRSLAKMKVLNRLMEFEYYMEMPDIAKSSLVRNHIAKLRTSIDQIRVNLNHVVKTKEQDVLDEFCGELLDTIEVLCQMDLESLKSFNNDMRLFLEKEMEVQKRLKDDEGGG